MNAPFKVILVGCGGISRAWLNAVKIMPDIQVGALVDLREDTAQERAEEFGLGDAYVTTDMDKALARIRPEAVFDCTVPEAHHAVTLNALAHGCHVLGEKPLADTMEHAREMVNAAQEANRTYAVIQNRRYLSDIIRLWEFLDSGVLGRITTVNCDFYKGVHFGGFRDRMEHVLLLDMAIHTFDQARKITGADAKAVYCHEWNPPGSWYDYDASAVALFEMSDDIVFTYRGSWCSEGRNTTWESDWRIVGEKGSITWDGGENFQVETVKATGGFTSEMEAILMPELPLPLEFSGHAGVIRNFVDSIKQGTQPQTVASDNIKSLAMVFGAIESAETHKRVVLED